MHGKGSAMQDDIGETIVDKYSGNSKQTLKLAKIISFIKPIGWVRNYYFIVVLPFRWSKYTDF